jgi:hypothetical protein
VQTVNMWRTTASSQTQVGELRARKPRCKIVQENTVVAYTEIVMDYE